VDPSLKFLFLAFWYRHRILDQLTLTRTFS
jgi:hypothetical protein